MIRDLEKDDYPTLVGWWEAQKFPVPPEVILPSTGYMSDEMAAGYLYLTNSRIAWLEWVVADPKAPKCPRSKAIDEVVNHICNAAKITGAALVFTSANLFPFCERLRRLGFKDGDQKTNHFVRTI